MSDVAGAKASGGKSLPQSRKGAGQASAVVANGGKSPVAQVVEVVANASLPPLAPVAELFARIGQVREAGQVATAIPKGWRLEKRGKYWRWRWQLKDRWGNSITYKTKSGNTGYKRGSQYVGKIKPETTK